jgi:excisionase family DNA binding protein
MPDRLLTQKEVAARLTITVEWLRKLRRAGKVEFVRIGWRTVRIRESEVERLEKGTMA